MIGKYVWQKETYEDGIEWVYVRCDICGHERHFLHSYLQRVGKNKNTTFLPCDRCVELAKLERNIGIIIYASNEVFLK